MSAERKKHKDVQAKAVKIGEVKPVATGGPVTALANKKVSRRTLLKGTATAAAVVGVSAVAMKEIQFEPLKEQSTGSIQEQSSVVVPTATLPLDPFAAQYVTLTVNGTPYSVSVEPRDMLANVLRDQLGLVGTKMACNRMSCGACTVLIDNQPIESCQYPALRAVGHSVLTVEAGVPAQAPTSTVAADPVIVALQNAWVQNDGGQCAFCGAGNIMAAAGLLKANTSPTVDQIKQALSGNLCRCGNYLNIIASVQAAATSLGGA